MTLLQHQVEGAEWLAERDRGILGDKPGLGKTRTILTALKRRGAKDVLVVCPAFVRSHWWREAQAAGALISDVISYDELVRGGMRKIAELTLHYGLKELVVDEYHYCKSTNAKRTAMVFGRDGLAKRMNVVYAASGTPIHRHPGDTWPVMSALFPQLCIDHGLRTHAEWTERFCVTRGSYMRGRWIEKVVGVRNADELHAILGQVMLRRDPQMDNIWWQVLPVETGIFEDEKRELNNLWLEVEGQRLDEIAADPSLSRMRRRIGELKVAPVAEMILSQLGDSEEKVVVMFHHRSVGEALRRLLSAFGVSYVDGDTTPKARQAALDTFVRGPNRVFLGQQQACGTGVDGLQHAAHRVILVEPSWIANDNVQAGARLDRMGQRASNVIGQMICLADTLDEAIVAQNKRETETVAESLGPLTGRAHA